MDTKKTAGLKLAAGAALLFAAVVAAPAWGFDRSGRAAAAAEPPATGVDSPAPDLETAPGRHRVGLAPDAVPRPGEAASGPPLHSVVGSALVDMNDDFGIDVVFRVTVAARQYEGRPAEGRVVTELFSIFEPLDPPIVFLAEVTCLEVDGDVAYVASRIDHSNLPALVGLHTVTGIQDADGPAPDRMHQELAENLVDLCGDPPDCPGRAGCVDALLFTEVDSGGYQVR